jgi:hypothetical protein
MRYIRAASAAEVFEQFREDWRVRATGKPWPSTPFEQLTLLREAGRRTDDVLVRAWSLRELDRKELLNMVSPVWSPSGFGFGFWCLGQMLEAVQAGSFELPQPNNVEDIRTSMRADPMRGLPPLVGYWRGPEIIDLDDGHNRITAAGLEGVIPDRVEIYVGEMP